MENFQIKEVRYYLYKENETWGPYEETEIVVMLKEGRILISDLAALEGSNDWEPLARLLAKGTSVLPGDLPSVPETANGRDGWKGPLGSAAGNEMQTPAASVFMERINALKPGDFIQSDSSKVHFRDIVPSFEMIGATRKGSRTVNSREGDSYVVDIYFLRDGREVLAGYRDPKEKAGHRGLLEGRPGEDVESVVKRLVAWQLEVEGGVGGVLLDEELGESGLGADPLSLVELTMACESEFGVSFGDEDVKKMGEPSFKVADLVAMVKREVGE